jgi:hypothetical protein
MFSCAGDIWAPSTALVFFILVVKIIVKFIRKELWYNRIKVGRNGKMREPFPAPMQEMGVETQNGGPHL